MATKRMRGASTQPVDPEYSELLESLKKIVRSHRQPGIGKADGLGVLPKRIRDAVNMVVIQKQSIRVTDEVGNQVAIIPAHWIPLFERLESARFTHDEIVALEGVLPEEEYSVEKRSKEIVLWAKQLKQQKKSK